jgi:DNA integrity scanning protein DisA with diadenylate cyclase activity
LYPKKGIVDYDKNIVKYIIFSIIFVIMCFFDIIGGIVNFTTFWAIKEFIDILFILICYVYGSLIYSNIKYPKKIHLFYGLLCLLILIDFSISILNFEKIGNIIEDFYNSFKEPIKFALPILSILGTLLYILKKTVKAFFKDEIEKLEKLGKI